MTIYFYSRNDAYAWLSNFSAHGFELDGSYWPTVEHWFQAQKFPDTPMVEQIRRARDPKRAKSLGRSRATPLRRDWEEVKDEVMYRGVRRKFETHDDLRKMLLETGTEDLAENAPGDYYWGTGGDGSGQNRLGKILMRVREELRGAAS